MSVPRYLFFMPAPSTEMTGRQQFHASIEAVNAMK